MADFAFDIISEADMQSIIARLKSADFPVAPEFCNYRKSGLIKTRKPR